MDYIFEQGKFTEDELEKSIIMLFEKQGYTYLKGENIHRKYEEVLITDDLIEFLLKKYKNKNLSDSEIKKIIAYITNISGSQLYESNKEAFYLINEGFDLQRDNVNDLALHIDFIDFDNIDNNIFKVVNQYSIKQGENIRRPDLLIFINGIPVGICEFKTAIKEETTIYDAWKQITIRYNRDIPKLMKYCFISIISDGANTKMGSIFTPYAYYYSWNKSDDNNKVSNGISSLFTMIEGAFSKERIIMLLRDFIFYPDNSSKNEAIICRYPQFFATLNMFESIKNKIRPIGDGKGGVYFGATGCGKTYTMLFLSRFITLRANEEFNNPTIIIITDREDLDTQTSELFVRAKTFLHEADVRSIETREDLEKTLRDKPSGGVYITTIQKFCEQTGLLSNRNNIICISDEAHRTQTGVGSKLKVTDDGIITTYGFAKYLRSSFPNATYCGFTGTPIDETIAVFGKVVDQYTMKESSDDGITVRISYEPRLARVIISDEQVKEIQKYYNKCAEEGSNINQIEESKRAMSRMTAILSHPDRIRKLAFDIVNHYESLCNEKPNIVQKAMIVCNDRKIAFDLLKTIVEIRPNWGEKKKSEKESELSQEDLEKLVSLPKINLVATRGQNDEKELYDICGTKEYRKMLDRQFKNNDSNFKIAIVVDMWITGFDVPSLSVMYIDKPLKKHTLIQTISRVNRVFEGKDKGLVVDYIGIKEDMQKAIVQYGGEQESPVDEIKVSLNVFRNHLSLIGDLFNKFDSSKFFNGNPLERLECLNQASEYIQYSKEIENRFMLLSKRLKSAYLICFPTGELKDDEVSKAQFYLAIRSIIYKQTKDDSSDAEMMNSVVEEMVKKAIMCTGVENIIEESKKIDLFSEEYIQELSNVKLPITKFNALLKLLKKSINIYSKSNKVKSVEFDKRLKKVVEKYNSRDKLVFTSEVVSDFVESLSDELLNILNELIKDKKSFENLGITFEEKVFYDILVKVRDEHKFSYNDEKCIELAKSIKKLVDDKSKFADWSTRNDIKNELNMDLTVLLYNNGYPPEWDDEVFSRVFEQAENFKNYNN